jgi:hypothetical protein
MIWTAAVAVDGANENDKMVKTAETVREVVDNRNGW